MLRLFLLALLPEEERYPLESRNLLAPRITSLQKPSWDPLLTTELSTG